LLQRALKRSLLMHTHMHTHTHTRAHAHTVISSNSHFMSTCVDALSVLPVSPSLEVPAAPCATLSLFFPPSSLVRLHQSHQSARKLKGHNRGKGENKRGKMEGKEEQAQCKLSILSAPIHTHTDTQTQTQTDRQTHTLKSRVYLLTSQGPLLFLY
jgi:hypothetical protein